MSSWGAVLGFAKKWTVDVPMTVLNVTTGVGVVVGTVFLIKYRREIRQHRQTIEDKLIKGLVYRDKAGNKSTKEIKVLELHPTFLEQHKESWQLCSLGDYLSTLRWITDSSTSDLSQLLEQQLYVVVGALLLKTLGDTVGAALLPVLQSSKGESLMGILASRVVHYLVAQILVNRDDIDDWDPTEDQAAMALNISEVISFVNLNQKLSGGNGMDETPMDWMEKGEIAYDPTYCTPPPSKEETESEHDDSRKEPQKILIPNPFVVEDDFEAAIAGLEDRLRETNPDYDPNDRSSPTPTPINETILPGLHLGWGDAKVTHTQRERLRNRLFCVLLTKLSYNYERYKTKKQQNSNHVDDDDDDDENNPYFVVRMDGTDCRYPDEFVQTLLDTGHSIEVCPRSTITTFGLAACVKEDDGTWTNIPVAFFLRTGYESRKRRPAYFSPLHGGLDMRIKGPLVGYDDRTGRPRKCDIQFYMAIEGMCGWHSNHNADVPWIESVSTTKLYNKKQSLEAVRMAGVLGCVFNQIGTEMDLPYGGYGVLGVCNDTAALIDFGVRGETNMYPLLSTGRFLMHIAKFLKTFHDKIVDDDGINKNATLLAGDTLKLIHAACNMDSDIHCAPRHMHDAARRYQANYPKAYFQIIEDSTRVMKEISQQYTDLEGKVKKLRE